MNYRNDDLQYEVNKFFCAAQMQTLFSPAFCRVRNTAVVSNINVIFEIMYNLVKVHLVGAIIQIVPFNFCFCPKLSFSCWSNIESTMTK